LFAANHPTPLSLSLPMSCLEFSFSTAHSPHSSLSMFVCCAQTHLIQHIIPSTLSHHFKAMIAINAVTFFAINLE